MTQPTAKLEHDLARVRDFIGDSVPAYPRTLELLSSELATPFRQQLDAAWAERTFGAWYERPLLLLAALRASALRDGEEHPLVPALRDARPDPDAVTPAALRAAVTSERTFFWQMLRDGAVQTNEVSRAVAWLWPASIVQARLPGISIDLHDIGASAGLNLVADGMPRPWRDAAGASLVGEVPTVGQRHGYDRSPLDPSDPTARLWLRACLWPGQRERLAKLDAALYRFDQLREAGKGPCLVKCNARETPACLNVPTAFALAYQTVMRGYLSEEESHAYGAGMCQWLRAAPGRALWVELEPTHSEDPPDRSAALVAHVADANGDILDLELARCHPHPQQLHVAEDAVTRLGSLLG